MYDKNYGQIKDATEVSGIVGEGCWWQANAGAEVANEERKIDRGARNL